MDGSAFEVMSQHLCSNNYDKKIYVVGVRWMERGEVERGGEV